MLLLLAGFGCVPALPRGAPQPGGRAWQTQPRVVKPTAAGRVASL